MVAAVVVVFVAVVVVAWIYGARDDDAFAALARVRRPTDATVAAMERLRRERVSAAARAAMSLPNDLAASRAADARVATLARRLQDEVQAARAAVPTAAWHGPLDDYFFGRWYAPATDGTAARK